VAILFGVLGFEQTQGRCGHLMKVNKKALGQNKMARWSKYSDQVPVQRRQKREGKEKHTEKTKWAQEIILCLPLMCNVLQQKNIQHPLKKEKGGNTVC
jgi:hypothetical protein